MADVEDTAKDSEEATVMNADATGSVPGEDEKTPPVSKAVGGVAPAFPEGGAAAWATVAGAFLIQFAGFGYTTSFGVYEDYYTRIYLSESAPSAISWIGSVNAFIIISGGLLSGRLYDRGYFYQLLWGGSLLQCFSLFMLSLCKPQKLYQIFLAQGLGVGLGSGIVYVPSVSVLSHYFARRRAFAMSIVASGSSLGASLHPIMLNHLLNRPGFGFANAVRASAGTVTGAVLVACLLMRTRLPPPAKGTLPPFWGSLRRYVKDGAYVVATVGMFLFAIGLYFPIFYIQLDAIQHGVSPTFSFYSLVILNASSLVGRLAPAPFLARAGPLGIPVMQGLAMFCCTVLIFSMIALHDVGSVVGIGVVYGFSSGVYITLTPPIIAFLTDNMSELGLRLGISFAFVGIGGLIGPPIHGALLTGTGRYVWWRPAMFAGIVCALGTACFVVVVIIVRRRYLRKMAMERGAEKH
uniref:MFS general substrate transporter n=1 Tax=Mycena chlorophos TaxID=658473 RepID=A0ABQ0LGB4_MYCCL|nr:MFS general substrate transporter [Mycena chlorophos]